MEHVSKEDVLSEMETKRRIHRMIKMWLKFLGLAVRKWTLTEHIEKSDRWKPINLLIEIMQINGARKTSRYSNVTNFA